MIYCMSWGTIFYWAPYVCSLCAQPLPKDVHGYFFHMPFKHKISITIALLLYNRKRKQNDAFIPQVLYVFGLQY